MVEVGRGRAVLAWARTVAPLRIWALLYALATASYVAAVWIRTLFAPDTRYYGAKALLWAGNSQGDAYRTLLARANAENLPLPPPEVTFHLPLTESRVVYPGLSVPFVAVWGINGMAVVSALAYFALVAVIFVVVSRRWGYAAAVVPLVLMLTSSKVLLFSVLMLTEGLTALWSAVLLLIALRPRSGHPARFVAILAAVTTIMAFTRQSTLIPAGAFGLAWFALLVRRRTLRNRWALPAFTVLITTIVVQHMQNVIWPGFSQLHQFELVTHSSSVLGALRGTPDLFWHVVATDSKTIAAADLPLLVLILGNFVAWVMLWRREETYLAAGALVGALLYNVTNGTPSGFRYEMPTLPFLALSLAALVATAAGIAPRHRGGPAREDEPPDPAVGRRAHVTGPVTA
jgi:hypothetical protein